MKLRPWQEAVLFILLIGSVLALGFGPDRSNSSWLLGFAGVAFLAYAVLANSDLAWKRTLLIAIAIRAALFVAPVGWTDDHFRYVFDGGTSYFDLQDVYDITPSTRGEGHNELGAEFTPLVNHTETYTVYPPFAQFVFANAYALGSGRQLYEQGHTNIDAVITWMRVIILLLEILSFVAILHLLRLFSLPRSWLAWYALNPLVIMEFSVNVHTEVYMVTWCLLALLALAQKRYFAFSVLLGIAAAAKLWPLMFLAFLPAWLGWGKAIKHGLLICATFIVLWIPFYSESLVDNMLESLNLYFTYFEFNASFYYILKDLLPEGWVKGSSLMSILTVFMVIVLALWAWRKKWSSAPEGMLWAMAIYFAFASTVHPWYILPLLAFGTLSHYRWPIIWSALIIPTYLCYAQEPYAQAFWWLWIEYIVLFGIIALELMVHSTWAMKRRAAIKFAHLKDMIPAGAKVLDVGTGNGSLSYSLMANGHDISTVDVVNKSRFEEVKPVLIDGQTLPFADNSFDVVLIITVLHHTRTQTEILREAKRVGRKLIVMEDVYTNGFQKYLTYLFDSLINLEFWWHPHTNRNEEEWESLFGELGLQVSSKRDLNTLAVFKQSIFVLS